MAVVRQYFKTVQVGMYFGEGTRDFSLRPVLEAQFLYTWCYTLRYVFWYRWWHIFCKYSPRVTVDSVVLCIRL